MCDSKVKESVKRLTFIGLWFCMMGFCGIVVNNLFFRSALIELLVDATIALGVVVFSLSLLAE